MNTKKVEAFLKKYYEYGKKAPDIMTVIGGNDVIVKVGSVTSSSGPVSFLRSLPTDKELEKKRFFAFYGETEDGETTYIRDAIKRSKHNTDDYIIAVEPFENQLRNKSQMVFRGMVFDELLKLADNHYDVGVYSKYVDGTPKYNLVMIRVIENGNEVTKYLDAYMASSDIHTFHDLHYTVAQFKSSETEAVSPQNSTDWPHNVLIFGAPGTGKSHSIKKKINDLGWDQNTKRVTFYEDYSYEKFIGAFLPSSTDKTSKITGTYMETNKIDIESKTDNSIEYRFVPGVFLELVVDAWFDSKFENRQNYVMVIEEINRANAAAVFGDFFQLLDRDSDGISEYSITLSDDMRKWIREYLLEKVVSMSYDDKEQALVNLKLWINEWLDDFRLPGNLYIWATMNSADQGVYPMDAAFKRRWSYIYKTTLETRGKKITIRWKKENEAVGNYVLQWDVLKTAINQVMEEKKGNIEEDRFIGPWYFKDRELDEISNFSRATAGDRMQDMSDPLSNKLFQYLRQDVFRNNPTEMFHSGYLTMSKIREGMINGVGINQILRLDDIKVNNTPITEIMTEEPSQATDSTGQGEDK